MKAAIISIGDELLIGQTINTNASWMGEQLTDIGIKVDKVFTISDQEKAITDTLDTCKLSNYDFVFITGGLGPTNDDITKKVLCNYFKDDFIQNKAVLDNVHRIFKAYNREVKQVNINQSLVPSKSKVFVNTEGTAPGMWMKDLDSKMVVLSMPGVPREMKYLMTNCFIPEINKHYKLPVIYRKTLLTQGIGESAIAEIIEDIENNLPQHINLAYLPSAGMVKLRLFAFGSHKETLKEEVEYLFKKISARIPEYIYGWDKELLEEIIVKLLQQQNLTISTAESLTGGKIANSLTKVPGCSAVFKGSVVAYQNEIKTNVLGVDEKIIDQFSPVSESVITQMARGVKKLMKSDIALATSGIAGPEGGTDENPVGTVWIAIAIHDEVFSSKIHMGQGREAIVLRTTRTVLNELRKKLIKRSK